MTNNSLKLQYELSTFHTRGLVKIRMSGSIEQCWKSNYCQTKMVKRCQKDCKQRGAESIDGTKKQNVGAKMCKGFGRHFPSTLHPLPPTILCLRDVCTLNPRPRPRPSASFASMAALASRSLSTTESWASQAAKCSGVEPREPWPKAKPQTGEKSEKFWAPQKSKFWKVWSLKLPVNLRDIVVLKSSSWLKRMLLSVQYPLVFHWRHISHVASQGDFYKSNILQL